MIEVKTVSWAAVESRVRRALRRAGESLRKTRPGMTWMKVGFGDYYTVDGRTGFAERRHCDLKQLAFECNAIRPGEVVEDRSSRSGMESAK